MGLPSGMEFEKHHQKTLDDLLKWRRDVRHFQTQPVPEHVLKEIEAAVDLAPSVGNSRPWRFVRVRSKEARRDIIRSFEEANQEAAQAYVESERNAYLSLKLAGLREAPHQYAIFTMGDPAEGRGLGRQSMPEMLAYSTVTAIYTLWLVARAHNVGVGWVSILDPETVEDVLDVPDDWQLTSYLCVGYPSEEHDTPELERKGWQENTPTKWIDR